MILLGLIAAAAASVAFNVGIVLQAMDARTEPAEEGLRLSLLASLVRRRRWVAGLLLGGVGFGLQILALEWAPFVVVQPMLAAGLLIVLFLGVRMLDERVGRMEIAGVLAICGGIALLAVGTPSSTEHITSEPAVIAVVAGLIAVSLVPYALRGRGRLDSAMFVIVASATAFGASNVATKLLSDGTSKGHWLFALIWLAVAGATGLIALTSEMTALQRRPATVVVPISMGVQTFLPVLLEPIYLTEKWASAPLDGVPLILGLLAVGAGALAISRTKAVSSLVGGEIPDSAAKDPRAATVLHVG